MKQVNEASDANEKELRISMDAKATVKVGPFGRGGKSRVPTNAADHDFESLASVTPVGILMPETGELFLYAVTRHQSPVIVWSIDSSNGGKRSKSAFLMWRP